MRGQKESFFIFAFISIIWLITSCVPSKPVYEEQVLPADRLIKKLEANRRKIKTFQGNGVLNVNSDEISAKATFEILLKKPDSIMISVFGPFGIDLAKALVTKDDFIFYDVIRNNVYMGKNQKGILKRIFKIDLSFDDIMDTFAGAVNLTDKLRKEPDNYTVLDDVYILTYRDAGTGKQSVYTINIIDLAIINYELMNSPNSVLFEGQYSDFKQFDNVPIPFKTYIENKLEDQNVEILYRNIHVNEKIDRLTFAFPNDARIIEW